MVGAELAVRARGAGKVPVARRGRETVVAGLARVARVLARRGGVRAGGAGGGDGAAARTVVSRWARAAVAALLRIEA